MPKFCGTCTHWQSRDFAPDLRPDLDTVPDDYVSIEAPGSWGYCKFAGEFGPRDTSNRFYVMDGSEYAATLHTRSDFGCIDHQGNNE